MRGAPQSRFARLIFPEEVSNFTRHFRPSRFTLPTLPGPIQSESPAMPGHDRFRLDDDECRTPAGPQLQQPCLTRGGPPPSVERARAVISEARLSDGGRARISNCKAARVWKQERSFRSL